MAAKDFYSTAHQKIYQAMLDNYHKDIAVDYITVSKVLETKGELEAKITSYLAGRASESGEHSDLPYRRWPKHTSKAV